MNKPINADPILFRFRHALEGIYGERLERMILFGSRARGEARGDSDYDVAIFIKDFQDRWQEIDKILPVVTDVLMTEHAFIHALPYGAGTYAAATPLMKEIRREGVDV